MCLNIHSFIYRIHTLKSFILDALGSGIFDFLVCFGKIGEFGLKSKNKEIIIYE